MTQSTLSNAQYLNQLVLQIAQQDEKAYLELFDSCAGRLKAYAIKCGSNHSDAEDLLQECLLTVWNKAPQFNPKTASAMTWMYTIIRNRRIDLLRKEKPNLIQSFDLWPDGDLEQSHSDQFSSSQLDDDVETIFLMADVSLQPIASKLVKEIARFGGDIAPFVSPAVHQDVSRRVEEIGRLGDY